MIGMWFKINLLIYSLLVAMLAFTVGWHDGHLDTVKEVGEQCEMQKDYIKQQCNMLMSVCNQ
jgi:lipopolysaccharide biosynthesis regulator YciM